MSAGPFRVARWALGFYLVPTLPPDHLDHRLEDAEAAQPPSSRAELCGEVADDALAPGHHLGALRPLGLVGAPSGHRPPDGADHAEPARHGEQEPQGVHG